MVKTNAASTLEEAALQLMERGLSIVSEPKVVLKSESDNIQGTKDFNPNASMIALSSKMQEDARRCKTSTWT